MYVRQTISNREVWIATADYNFLSQAADAPKGGFATAIGYKPKTNIITQPVYNLNFISRFSTHKFYARKIDQIKSIKFEDVAHALTGPKFAQFNDDEKRQLFQDCKEGMILSMNKSIGGVVDSAQRAAHDLFYVQFSQGVKCHLKTEDGKDGKQLVLLEGLPIVNGVMLNILEVGRKVIEAGSYKTVNSGPKVLMDNAIEKALPKTAQLKTLTFNPDNHEALKIGGEVYEAELLERSMMYVD
jgi:hypothetical protein